MLLVRKIRRGMDAACTGLTGAAIPACFETMMLSTFKTEMAAAVLELEVATENQNEFGCAPQNAERLKFLEKKTHASLIAQSLAAYGSSMAAFFVEVTPLFSP